MVDMNKKYEVGVVVCYEPNPELIIRLLDTCSDVVMVLIDPFDPIPQTYLSVGVGRVSNNSSDLIWSENLDKAIFELVVAKNICIFGSHKDISRYCGKHKIKFVEN